MPERMKNGAWRRQWAAAKEEIRLMRTSGMELLAASAKAEMLVDGLFEGLYGEEAPDLSEVSA